MVTDVVKFCFTEEKKKQCQFFFSFQKRTEHFVCFDTALWKTMLLLWNQKKKDLTLFLLCKKQLAGLLGLLHPFEEKRSQAKKRIKFTRQLFFALFVFQRQQSWQKRNTSKPFFFVEDLFICRQRFRFTHLTFSEPKQKEVGCLFFWTAC